MSRTDDLRDLKERAQSIKARLQLLNNRIGEIRDRPRIRGLKAVVDGDRCVACGICADQCPEGAVVIDRTAHVDARRCTGCGQCIYECPRGAISLCPAGLEHRRQAGKLSEKEFLGAVRKNKA